MATGRLGAVGDGAVARGLGRAAAATSAFDGFVSAGGAAETRPGLTAGALADVRSGSAAVANDTASRVTITLVTTLVVIGPPRDGRSKISAPLRRRICHPGILGAN